MRAEGPHDFYDLNLKIYNFWSISRIDMVEMSFDGELNEALNENIFKGVTWVWEWIFESRVFNYWEINPNWIISIVITLESAFIPKSY